MSENKRFNYVVGVKNLLTSHIIYFPIDIKTQDRIIKASKAFNPEWESIILTATNIIPILKPDDFIKENEDLFLYRIDNLPELPNSFCFNSKAYKDEPIVTEWSSIYVNSCEFYIKFQLEEEENSGVDSDSDLLIYQSFAIPISIISYKKYHYKK